jgi:hypothetical protein
LGWEREEGEREEWGRCREEGERKEGETDGLYARR